MEVQDEVLDLMFDLTYKVTNYVRNNRHCKDGPRIKDVMLFKTIYKAENHQITMSELANILGVSAAAVSQMIAGFEKKGLLQRCIRIRIVERSIFKLSLKPLKCFKKNGYTCRKCISFFGLFRIRRLCAFKRYIDQDNSLYGGK